MKVGNLVSRSLRLIGHLDPNQSPKAKDYDTCIEALNALAMRLEANGLAMGWSPVSQPDADLPVPDEWQDGMAYLLGLQVAPEFSIVPNPQIRETAQTRLMEMRRDAYTRNDNAQNLNLPGRGRWNIYTDSPGTGWMW